MFQVAVSLFSLKSWTTTPLLAFGGISRIRTGKMAAAAPRRSILVGGKQRAEYAHRLFDTTSQQQQQQQKQQQSQEKTPHIMKTSIKKDDSVPLGGDFAGLFATYDLTGGLIPVPDYYVPDSLLEWGQAPPGLEVLVSEDNNLDFASAAAAEAEATESSSWKRYELTVLPETGCGIDNLEVLKRSEEIPVASIRVFGNDSDNDDNENKPMVRTLMYSLPNSSQHRIRVESTFAVSPRHENDDDNDDDHGDVNTPYRSRLAIDLLWDDHQHQWKPQAPLRLFLERQTSLTSSQGTRADGGGLDGRTVSTLIGRVLRQYEKQLGNTNQGRWKSVTDEQQQSHSNLVSDSDMIVLPTNLTVAYGPTTNENEWCLQIGQIDYSSSNNTRRLVVEHTWSTKSSLTKEPPSCSNVHYWKEQGSFQQYCK